jgi:hypothetical protein
VGDRHQGHVMLPPGPGSSFNVVKPQRALQFPIILLEPASGACRGRPTAPAGRRWQVRQPVLDRLGLVAGPFDQQPTHRQLPPGALSTGGSPAAWVTPAGRTPNARKRERCRPLLARRQLKSTPAHRPAARASWVSETGLSRYRGGGRRPRPVEGAVVGRTCSGSAEVSALTCTTYRIWRSSSPWRNSPTSP